MPTHALPSPTSLLAAALGAALLATAGTPALAQSADFNTWTAAGDVLLAGPRSAVLTTAYLDESPVSAGSALLFDELEAALSLQGGSLPGDTFEGSGLQHGFDTAGGGSVLRFDWLLSTVDFDAGQADRAFVLVDGGLLLPLGTAAAGPVGGQFSLAFTTPGPHALAIVVMDVNTTDRVSTLSISNLGVSAVPEPGAWALLLAGAAGLGLARRRAAQPTV